MNSKTMLIMRMINKCGFALGKRRRHGYRMMAWAVVFLMSLPCSAADYLFQSGKSSYRIVLPLRASGTELQAAKELQAYLKRISGAELPMLRSDVSQSGKNVYVGYSQGVKSMTGKVAPTDDEQQFTYFTRNGNLFIYGGRQQGTLYGVYAFLENELGVKWLSWDCTKIPTMGQFQLGSLRRSERPAITYRHVFYYQSQHHLDWTAHNRLNGYSGMVNHQDYGKLGGAWGVHTMGTLVSPDKYFATHPEYFSLCDGKRIPDGQLCLSNEAVIRLLTRSILDVIGQNKGWWAYNVGQNDNLLYCECPRCRAIEDRYGGHSGLMIWAVNQVAAEVKKVYPDANISTFAYHYTQRPPVGIKPSDNVFIQLCDIDGCFIHPVTDAENHAFMDDLEGWSKLTKNIYLWNYTTNFFSYLMPVPNMRAYWQNFKTFAAHRVYGIMTLGQYQTYGAGFDDLNAWVIAKLLWNPYQDADSLARVFIREYYGGASADVQAYFNLCNSLVTPSQHMTFTSDFNHSAYSAAFLEKSKSLLASAHRRVVNDSVLVKRVERLELQPMYIELQTNRVRALANGSYHKFMRILKRDNMNIGENMTAGQYMKKEGYI